MRPSQVISRAIPTIETLDNVDRGLRHSDEGIDITHRDHRRMFGTMIQFAE